VKPYYSEMAITLCSSFESMLPQDSQSTLIVNIWPHSRVAYHVPAVQ